MGASAISALKFLAMRLDLLDDTGLNVAHCAHALHSDDPHRYPGIKIVSGFPLLRFKLSACQATAVVSRLDQPTRTVTGMETNSI